jgi:hypothetical protein
MIPNTTAAEIQGMTHAHSTSKRASLSVMAIIPYA